MSYTQLTRQHRFQIYALNKEHHSPTEVARHLGLHQSTISPELTRNHGGRGARPTPADELAQARQQRRASSGARSRPPISATPGQQVAAL